MTPHKTRREILAKPEAKMTQEEAMRIALMRLNATTKDFGYTTSLVHRGGTTSNEDLICTIAPEVGDVVVARIDGRNGIYTP